MHACQQQKRALFLSAAHDFEAEARVWSRTEEKHHQIVFTWLDPCCNHPESNLIV